MTGAAAASRRTERTMQELARLPAAKQDFFFRIGARLREAERQRTRALRDDPAAIMRAMGLEPDPWQAQLLGSSAPEMLLNCSRQSGKSTVTAALATHTVLYTPGSLVLLLSPALRQSQELFRKCLEAYHAMGASVPADAENKLTLELRNGSRIVSLPGKAATIRGYSGVDLLIIDEASETADELYFATKPMLAVSGGRLIALSTPYGKRGWWYEAWMATDQVWERYEIPATLCPRITPETLAKHRAAFPAAKYDQEYMCAFMEPFGAYWSRDDIAAMFTFDTADPDLRPLFSTEGASAPEPAFVEHNGNGLGPLNGNGNGRGPAIG